MARLVGFYLQYIKRYTYIIIITYKGINVIIIVWFMDYSKNNKYLKNVSPP